MLEHALVGVDKEGVICFLEKNVPATGKTVDDIVNGWGWGKQNKDWGLVACKVAGQSWFFPGFIGMWKLISI